MAIALRHPITARVDDRASFLRSLLEEYPRFLNEWENSTEEEFAQTAKDNADGDKEIEHTIYSSLCSAFNDNAYRMNMFYQSVFLMCFSYYESCVAQLSKNTKTKEAIQAICKSKNISLSEESLNAIDYLQNDINDLRNNICHNNPQIRNYAPNMIQKRKESASLVKRGHSASNVTIKTYKCPLPHHAT